MPITTPWYVIEAQVHSLLNSIVGSGTAAAAETAYAALPKVNDVDVDDPSFPRMFVRRTIVQAHQQVVGWLLSTEGHPRRKNFRSTQTLGNLSSIPSQLSAIGAVYDNVTQRELTRLEDAAQLTTMLADSASQNGVSLFYYALKGNTFYTSVATAVMEYFDYQNPAPTDAALAALFDQTTDLIALDDEFENAIVYLAVGVLAAKSASYQDQAGYFLGLAKESLDSLGIKVSANDFSINSVKAA